MVFRNSEEKNRGMLRLLPCLHRVQSAKETSTTRPWQSLWFFFTLRTVISVPMLDSMNSFEEVAMRFSNVFNAAIRTLADLLKLCKK